MTLKGYKHTELGVLPEDWEVVRLGDIGKIVGGGTPSTKKVEFWSGTIPWISSSDIDENSVFDISQTRYITQEAISKSSTKPIEPNSILIVSRVGLGKVAVNQNILCTSQDIQALTQHKQNAFFLVYAIKNLVSLACRINQGTSIKGFTKEVLSNLCIPLPPLAEQEKIAEILSAWDTQIQNFETLIAEKQNLKKGLCQTLLTAKTRLKGFSGDWEVVRLGDVAHYKNGETLEDFIDPKGSFFLITLDSIDIKGKLKTNHKRIEISHNNTLKKGDIVMILSDIAHGNFLGLTGVISQDNLYVLNQRVGALKVDNKRANSIFLSLLINANQKYFKRMGQGTSQQNLRKGDIEKFIFSLPPLAEQEKIAEILGEGDKEIMLLEQKLESLKSQKRGLMQKLLGGKIRINFKG